MNFLTNLLRPLRKQYHAWRYQRAVAVRRFSEKTVAQIFTETYEKRYWKSKESVSGTGSELRHTETLRRKLPVFLKIHGIKSLLDLPCGDFNWMRQTDLSGIDYIGADIVAALVEANRRAFSGAKITFQKLDLLADPLPKVDCVLVRDCLVHLSFEHIKQALENLKRSGSQFLLATNFSGLPQNEDIQTGYWRPLNLEIAPFFFQKPMAVLPEEHPSKSLALWKIADLPVPELAAVGKDGRDFVLFSTE